ncbi:thioredoxin [Paenibacillus aestuarii]|uniref:Thioredoxin n=1 Tax=Paenibacillus aestuarii TaxID=516965 RepID=A0ABW0K986_9BACL|nr:thioredoxin [Paenibacillus aestuarii]
MDTLTLTKETFRSQVEHGVTLVDFYATWCGPCQSQLPIVEELAGEMKHSASVAKINIDEESEIASTYGVKSIPTLMIFKDGYVVETMVGLQSKSFLREKLDQYLSIGDTC